MNCKFCDIAAGRFPAHFVYEDSRSLAFLDKTPLFPGHVLLIPRDHVETFMEMPAEMVPDFFLAAQKISRAVEKTMQAEGVFVAINNRVSQSVPHLHTHIVPRKKGDGLKGFFWPRKKYASEEHMAEIAGALRAELK